MSRHRFPAQAWPKYRNRVLTRLVPLMVLAVGVGYWIAVRGSSLTPSVWIVGLPPVMVAIGLLSALRRTRHWFDSYELELSDHQITRRQKQTPDLVLRRADVKSIVESRDRGITLLGPTRFAVVGIPAELEGYATLADQVRAWAPSGPPPSTRAGVASLGAGVAVVVLFGTAFLASRPAVGAAAAALLAIFLVWAFVELRRNPNLDRKTRRAGWLVALPAAALVVRVARFLILGE